MNLVLAYIDSTEEKHVLVNGLHYLIANQLHILAIQGICMFLVMYILGDIVDNKRYLLGVFMIVIGYQLVYIAVNLIATAILWVMAILLLRFCKKEWYEAVLLASFSMILYILLTYLVGEVLLTMVVGHMSIIDLQVAASSTFYLLVAFGLKALLKWTNRRMNLTTEVKWTAAIVAALTFVGYFVIISIERFADTNYIMGYANSMYIVGYGVISGSVFLVLLYLSQKAHAAKERQTEWQYLKNYTNQLEQSYTEMRRFRHDYQNILMSIEAFIEEQDLIGLERYFHQKIKQTSTTMTRNDVKLTQLSNIKLSELKSILASKLMAAQELGIDTEIEVNEPIETVHIDSIMLIRSMGIILDNAIEAASTIPDGSIRVAVFKRNEAVNLVVVNSCEENIPKLFQLKQEGFSTKGAGRGMGLSNLESLVAAGSNVLLETKINQGLFSQILSVGA